MEGFFLRQPFSVEDDHDLIIQAGEGQNMKELFAHSFILCAKSEYFNVVLSTNWVKKENGIIIFETPNISPKIMELILKYFYTETIDLDTQNGKELVDLLTVTDELNLQILANHILRKDPVRILRIVFQYEASENSCKFCLEAICEDPKMLFESPKFTSLEQDLVILLLKQDNLKLEAIETWEFVLKWGLKRMSVQNNVDQWTSSNFEELEKILHDLIPLVKWSQIPEEDFWPKIYKFRKILSTQLYNDITKKLSNYKNKRRIIKELDDLDYDPLPFISACPIGNDLYNWQGTMMGPIDTPYSGGIFLFIVQLPTDYPFKPPKVTFTTRIYHPNINNSGCVRMDLLTGNGWSPAHTIRKALLAVYSFLICPDSDNPTMRDIAHVYNTDIVRYNDTVREWTRKYAM